MRPIGCCFTAQWALFTLPLARQMKIVIRKGADSDVVEAFRRDGCTTSFKVPHKGPIPHDAVHYFVEQQLGLHNGFWGAIARGETARDIGERAAAGGHASAKRASLPEVSIVELLQAERLVECFEADAWGGGSDDDAVLAMARSGWDQSLVPPLAMTPQEVSKIRQQIKEFSANWSQITQGDQIALDWPEA